MHLRLTDTKGGRPCGARATDIVTSPRRRVQNRDFCTQNHDRSRRDSDKRPSCSRVLICHGCRVRAAPSFPHSRHPVDQDNRLIRGHGGISRLQYCLQVRVLHCRHQSLGFIEHFRLMPVHSLNHRQGSNRSHSGRQPHGNRNSHAATDTQPQPQPRSQPQPQPQPQPQAAVATATGFSSFADGVTCSGAFPHRRIRTDQKRGRLH